MDTPIDELDPLDADEALASLPELNRRADIAGLFAVLRRIAPYEWVARGFTLDEAVAAMRDIGMVASSLRRHGVQPWTIVPEIEPILVLLGARTAMIPRDTVFHYGVWNPLGRRQRMFTGDPNENDLIACVRSSIPELEASIALLLSLQTMPVAAPEFVPECQAVAARIATLTEVIQFAKERVDPVFFARVLRPYFEPIEVGGGSYLGPAAAHIPLYLVDHLLWSSDCNDPELRAIHDETAAYGPPQWRLLYRARAHEMSLTSRALAELEQLEATDRAERASALQAVFRPLLTFRGRHRVIAGKAYDPSVRQFSVGSGGYAVPTLTRMLKLTVDHAKLLDVARR